MNADLAKMLETTLEHLEARERMMTTPNRYYYHRGSHPSYKWYKTVRDRVHELKRKLDEIRWLEEKGEFVPKFFKRETVNRMAENLYYLKILTGLIHREMKVE